MRSKLVSAGLAVAASLCVAAPAGAATIILNNVGGVEVGTNAYQGFTTAANFWASVISSPVTIHLDVGFDHLGANILGSTSSAGGYVATQNVELGLLNQAQTALDVSAVTHMPTMTVGQDGLGAITMVTPGYNATAPNINNPAAPAGDGLGVNTNSLVRDANGTFNNEALFVNTANLRALGFNVDPNASDGSITFSSDFNFDFNPRDGIHAGAIDFVGVAVHEIGHALGFTSGVDIYDILGNNGPLNSGNTAVCGVDCHYYDSEQDAFGTTLDLFRYANNPLGAGPELTWAPGVGSYLSVDGGLTSLGGFSTGSFNGDGWQASHWQAPQDPLHPCQNFIGVMNPYTCFGLGDAVTPADFEALDAIGWNFNFGDNRPTFTTAEISREFAIANVPEPAVWTTMLLGLGLAGAGLRRRRALVAA